MISTKKINKLKNIFDDIIHILFLVIGDMLRIGIMVFIGFGAIASMLLLYKNISRNCNNSICTTNHYL